jgi:hypothetical protein
METLRDIFERRLDEFRQGYGFAEQDEVIRALAVTGEMLDLVFAGNEASVAMTALRSIIAHGSIDDWDWSKLDERKVDRNWRKAWGEIAGFDASSTPPFLDELHDLNAFACFGISPIWNDAAAERLKLPEAEHLRQRLAAVQDMPAWVEKVCAKIDQFERLVPRRPDGSIGLEETLATRNLARARIKFDQGQALTVHDLAFLSRVTVKRVQNAVYAKTDEAPVVDRNGLIRPEACEPWLSTRDYQPSIWRQVAALYPLGADWGLDIAFEETEPDCVVDDFVFVPVANDGTMFVPAIRRDGKGHEGGYTIGAKGSEHVVPDYDAALEKLRKMEAPRWRRPNPESGNWGIVAGQTWKRVRRTELDGLSP